jgi:hypothetical protein
MAELYPERSQSTMKFNPRDFKRVVYAPSLHYDNGLKITQPKRAFF